MFVIVRPAIAPLQRVAMLTAPTVVTSTSASNALMTATMKPTVKMLLALFAVHVLLVMLAMGQIVLMFVLPVTTCVTQMPLVP